mgnify:CR=1 FL=1
MPRTALSAAVAEQLIRMIFLNGKRVVVPVLVSCLMCCMLLFGTVGTPYLAAWFLLCAAATGTRVLVLSRLVRRREPDPTAKLALTAALSLMTGSAYGSIVVSFPSIGVFERAMLTTMLISFCSGAVITNSGYRPVFLSFVLPILGSLALLWMLNPGQPIGDGLALFIGAWLLLIVVTLVVIAQDTFDAFAISAESSARQERLTAELGAALAEAESARTEAEISSRSKTRFLAAASHDLRQPVHVLSLYGAVLGSADMSPKARRIVDQMNTAVESLSAQLSSLLDLSRLDAGDVKPSLGAVDLEVLVGTLTAEFEKMADERGIALIEDLERPLFVRSDPEMLSRILRNLCGNALKYTFEGSVTLSARCGADVVTLAITDTGIGIDEHDRAHIFEEFYQASNAGRDTSEGLGLGLSIVQRLVGALRHEIEVSSVPGLGTTVSLRMERCRAPTAVLEPPARESTARGVRLPPGLWVHVVDDDAAVRGSMRALLEGHGCRVTLTACASSTLRFLERRAPAVILVDMRLGGETSGMDVIASVKNTRPGLAAALITGEELEVGANDDRVAGVPVFRKPLSEAELLGGIEALLERVPSHA